MPKCWGRETEVEEYSPLGNLEAKHAVGEAEGVEVAHGSHDALKDTRGINLHSYFMRRIGE